MFQATRRRLALWYSAVTAILLLLFASGVFWYVRNTLIDRVDDTLNHVVEVVERSLVVEPVGAKELSQNQGTAIANSTPIPYQINLEASFQNNVAAVDEDRIDLEWFSPTGQLLWSTFTRPLALPLHLHRHGETVQVWRRQAGATLRESEQSDGMLVDWVSEPLQLRQLTETVQVGDQVLGYLRVSHPWFEVTKPTRRLSLDLSFGIGLVAMAVAAIGWFLSGLAMEPIQESYQRLKQFTADASHELRSPIATIQTNVQVALCDPALSPSVRQQFQGIERLTRRLGRLVNDLLFLARQDSGMVHPRWQPCPLDALLMEVVEEQTAIATEKGICLTLDVQDPAAAPASERDVSTEKPILSEMPQALRSLHSIPPLTPLSVPCDDDLFVVQGDWDRLARLLTNLLANALQYTPAGGQVQVTLSQQRESGLVPSSWLQIEICDSGIGIPESARSRVFERFYRADPARTQTPETGSGLGLSIAQAIVENHQGQLKLESTPNQGTTAIVKLPQFTGRAAQALSH